MAFDDGRLPSPGTRDELEDFARSFNGLLDRLHVALERQRQFTGQASHQLRTPLAALIAAIEVARRRPRNVEEHELVLDRLHEDAVRLWRVVEALLFLARAEAEAALPDLERLDLADWAADHLRTWSGHERASDLLFDRRDGDSSWTPAHRPLLGQLLDNLLENACKYSEPGTPIVVRAWGEPDAVALSVEDRGYGIPAGDLPRVFEPFYRAESARRLGRAGVGLGLAVASRIAVTHGGTITAESEPGRGSRFVVRLPGRRAGRRPGGRRWPRGGRPGPRPEGSCVTPRSPGHIMMRDNPACVRRGIKPRRAPARGTIRTPPDPGGHPYATTFKEGTRRPAGPPATTKVDTAFATTFPATSTYSATNE